MRQIRRGVYEIEEERNISNRTVTVYEMAWLFITAAITALAFIALPYIIEAIK